MLSAKEVFSTIKEHLLKQQQKCADPEADRCLYKKGELRCAVGCLINEEQYTSKLENICVSNLDMDHSLLAEHYNTAITEKKLLLQAALVNSGVNVYDPITFEVLKAAQLILDNGLPKNWEKELATTEKELFTTA